MPDSADTLLSVPVLAWQLFDACVPFMRLASVPSTPGIGSERLNGAKIAVLPAMPRSRPTTSRGAATSERESPEPSDRDTREPRLDANRRATAAPENVVAVVACGGAV